MAKSTFVKMKKLLTSRDFNMELRMLRCYVVSALLYGVEAWTIKKNHIDKRQPFDIWCYHRMWRIPCTEVLNRIINIIKKRKVKYLGHIMRGQKYTLVQLIVQQGTIGKRDIVRRRVSWLKNVYPH